MANNILYAFFLLETYLFDKTSIFVPLLSQNILKHPVIIVFLLYVFGMELASVNYTISKGALNEFKKTNL
jgi:hypothetical protein